MSQFTNSYNGQNGMGVRDQSMAMSPGQMYPGNANWQPQMSVQSSGQHMYQPTQPAMQQPNTQGWKSYSEVPQNVRPTVGRWVSSFDEIKPQEVQMDGGMYFFPQDDYSCIYARFWDNNGVLQTFRFLPEKADPPAQSQPLSAEMNDILKGYESIATNVVNRLDSVEDRLNDIFNALPQKTAARSKKVEKEDE